MSWTADQLPIIARRILAEQKGGLHIDPHRLRWAEDVLRWFEQRDEAAGRRIGIAAEPHKDAA